MKAITLFLILLPLTVFSEVRLGWDDENPMATMVTEYRVYSLVGTNRTLVRVVPASPKTNDAPVAVTTGLTTNEALKSLTVTAVNLAGESPGAPPVTTPPVAVAPANPALAVNFASQTIEILWTDPNPPAAQVRFFRVYRQLSPTTWEKVAETPNATTLRVTLPLPTGKETFAVTAVNGWGDSPRSATVEVPGLLVPVSNLRLIVTTP